MNDSIYNEVCLIAQIVKIECRNSIKVDDGRNLNNQLKL